MLKNLYAATLSLFFLIGTIDAKEKAVPLKKFTGHDIGFPDQAGATKIIENGVQIVAGGADVWGVKDQFHFSYFEQSGDFDLVARVESLTAPHLYTKAGIMAREELSGDSRHIFFQVFPDNKARHNNNGGFEFQYRSAKAGEMKAIYPPKAEGIPEFPANYPNTWIRLQRVGNLFTGFWSADGKSWKVYTTYTVDLPKKIFLGLAVTSHNPKERATAVFRDIAWIK